MKPRAIQTPSLYIHRCLTILMTTVGMFIMDTKMSAMLRQSISHVDKWRRRRPSRRQSIQKEMLPISATRMIRIMIVDSVARSGIDVYVVSFVVAMLLYVPTRARLCV